MDRRPRRLGVYPPAKVGEEPRKWDANCPISWAVRDGYVIALDKEDGAEELVASEATQTLDKQQNYRADLAALGGSHLAVAWADLGGLGKMFWDWGMTQQLAADDKEMAESMRDVLDDPQRAGRRGTAGRE